MGQSTPSGARALRRLLRIRELEEEHCRNTLQSALAELRRMESLEAASAERERRGRSLFVASAHAIDQSDRAACLEEIRAAARLRRALAPRKRAGEEEVARLRQAYFDKRVERRQAETLISEAEAGDAIAANRRSQQGLDDYFLNRMERPGRSKGAPDLSVSEEET